MKGSLLEVNERLVKQPELLNSSVRITAVFEFFSLFPLLGSLTRVILMLGSLSC